MMRRKLAAMALTVTAATSGVVGLTSSPAMATPTNCSWARYTANSIVAICNGGSGNFRARITCHNSGPGGILVSAVGSWKTVASRSPSYAYCPKAGDTYEYGGINIQ
ncbi:hypothetical protein OWR29_43655 [Actinoplanes sp. Pm04-4]|uniref:Uncharacterized protein n=1 Tax=Paractinoplanes pyxinae TaxID=2997416 RepID=A0ABT4BEI6_9ACTN|nr:hypothetical protein [Actinoplanes pyxinae]MCY1144936.1 hypothetical protein [Actinoplanes pyxinae]